jgi:uncharacterized protein (TIGR00251 family)
MITDIDGGIAVLVHVQPGAKRTAAVGYHGDALKLAIAAAPRDGAANEAVVRLVAEVFDVPTRRVSIASGGRSRRKRVLISGLNAHDALERLDAIFPAK